MSSFLFGRRQERVVDPVNALPPERIDGRRTAAPVTFNSSLGVPAVWACVRLRADLISTLPVDAFRKRGGVAEALPKPPILTQPGGERVDLQEWLYAGQIALDLRGNNFGIIVATDNLALPKQIELVHPDTVSLRRNPDNGRLKYWINGKPYEPEEVWHERAHVVPGHPLGMSPIAYAATTVGVSIAAEQFGSDWFLDGAHPSSVITSGDPVDQPKARLIKDKFLASVRGKREPAVLGAGLKYQAIQMSPDESQFIETMKFGVQQVARLFGVPPEMIGGDSGGSLTYSNREQRNLDFLTFGIGPTLVRRETALSRLLPQPDYVKFNTGGLLRTDLVARYQAYKVGLDGDFIDTDEVRALEEWGPREIDPADQLAKKGEALGALVRAGFDPQAALAALGLDPIQHTGLVPVTVTAKES